MSIAVFLESYEGNMVKASKEAIAVAKDIAEKTGKELFGVAIDNTLDNIMLDAGKYGISTVKGISGVDRYHPGMYTRLIVNAAKDSDYVIIPATVWGREIAPQVTVKLDATPISDIIGVEDATTFKRSIHGNKVHSTVKGEGKMVITVRAGIFDVPAEGDGVATSEAISPEVVDSDSLMKLAEILAASSDAIELTEADIIVSGGRGMGGLMLAFTGCICPAILSTPYVWIKLVVHQILVSFF